MARSTRSGLVALGIASTLVAVAAAEVTIRSCYSVMPRIQMGEGETRLSDEVVDAIFDSDRELIWRLKKNLAFPEEDQPFRGVVSNGQRLREAKRVPLEKAPG